MLHVCFVNETDHNRKVGGMDVTRMICEYEICNCQKWQLEKVCILACQTKQIEPTGAY